MAEVKIIYFLNEEGRKESLLRGGNGKEIQYLYGEFTPTIKDIVTVSKNGDAYLPIGFNASVDNLIKNKFNSYANEFEIIQDIKCVRVSDIGKFGERKYAAEYKYVKGVKKFDTIPTFDQLIGYELSRINYLKKRKEALEEEYKKVSIEADIENDRVKKDKEERKENERKRREEDENRIKENRKRIKELELKRQIEKDNIKAWIKENGSEYLKDVLELEYEYKKIFILEYIDKELPNYEIDFDEECHDYKASPSKQAIDELKELLKKNYDASIRWDSDKECEVIIIKYLGYQLYKDMY